MALWYGRGAIGNPWIFKKIDYFLKTGKKQKEITAKEKLNIILEHIEKEVEEKGEITGIRQMRKHIAWYVKGLKDASNLRTVVNKIEEKEKLEQTLKEYFSII